MRQLGACVGNRNSPTMASHRPAAIHTVTALAAFVSVSRELHGYDLAIDRPNSRGSLVVEIVDQRLDFLVAMNRHHRMRLAQHRLDGLAIHSRLYLGNFAPLHLAEPRCRVRGRAPRRFLTRRSVGISCHPRIYPYTVTALLHDRAAYLAEQRSLIRILLQSRR